MAKHMETMEEACGNLWKLLDGLNKGFKGESKDAEQYHDIVASLYKLKGLEMAAQYEEDQGNGTSQRGGSYRGTYDNGGGRSGLYWEPWMQGSSYDDGSYDRYGGTSGRYQPRNAQGQFKADGRSNRGSSYHSNDEVIQDMRERMQDADPEMARAYRKVIRDMQEI